MEEDLFKKMMDRWGVKPTKKRKSRLASERAIPTPPRAPEPLPEPEPEPVDPDEALFMRAMDNLGVEDIEAGKTAQFDEPFLVEISSTPDEDARMFFAAVDRIEFPILKGETDEQYEHRAALRRIKMRTKQELKIGATLDLHGKRLEAALKELAHFVASSFAAGASSIMVITGKGRHSKGGTSVLKPAVERWILHRGKRFIARYGEAPRAYGGRGAFVLYLRDS